MSKKHLDANTEQIRKAEEAFQVFLMDTSLEDRAVPREHEFSGSSYGSNDARLGWGHCAFQQAIEAIRCVRPEASEKAVSNVLMQSMVSLFEKATVREDADPEVEAYLESILPTLEKKLGKTAITDEVKRILDLLLSRVHAYTVFIPLKGV